MTTNVSANRGTRTDNPVLRLMIKLPKTAKPIPNATNHWVDIDGTVYIKETQLQKKHVSIHNYAQVYIKYNNGPKMEYVHRLVATVFLPNPNNYPMVGHKNNIKTDNRVSNLYWTTFSENVQKAYDDKLQNGTTGNVSGFNEKIPVELYETITNKYIRTFDSIADAIKYTGYTKNTILKQLAGNIQSIRKYHYFKKPNDNQYTPPTIVGMYDRDTDQLLGLYLNAVDASQKTGYSKRTIAQQLKINQKPIYGKSYNLKQIPVYFLKYNHK